MARRFVVRTDFNAKDNTTGTMKRINRGFGRFAQQMADGNSVVGRSFGAVNKAINRTAMIGLASLAIGAGVAAREFVNLDQSVTQAGSKFKDISTKDTVIFQENLDKLSAAARAVGADTEFAATDAAGALDKFAMAGLRSDVSMALLRGTTDLATAANTDLTSAVDIATDSMGAFGVEMNNLEQAEAGLNKVSALLVRTTTTANTSFEDMFESIKAGAPAFTSAGQEMETFAAFTGVLANAGIKGSQAGTSLRNVMLRLAKPTGEAADTLEKLGVVTADSQGNFRDAIDILADLEKGLEGMGSQQRTAALATIFGARTVTGINVLLDQGADALRTYREESIRTGASVEEMAAAMRTSLSSQIAILKSGLLELGLQFIEAFEQDGRGALQGMIETVQNLDITPLVEFAKIAVAIFKFVASNWRIMLSLAAGIKAVAIAMGILNIVSQVFGKTLEATPIGKMITIIFLAITAIMLLVTHWDKIVAALKMAWEWIKKVAIAIWQNLVKAFMIAVQWIAKTGQKFTFILGPLTLVVSVLIEILKQWGKIRDAFNEGGILKGLLAIGQAILSGVLAPLQGALELASKIPGLGRLAAGGAERIASLREDLAVREGQTIGTPGTPTPTPGGPGALNSVVDVNFNNVPDNVNIRSNTAQGVNVNTAPTFQP